MEVKYLLTQAKMTNGVFSKGCAVHDTPDNARQAFHAYLSAYAYGHEAGTDYVFVAVHDTNGAVCEQPIVWNAQPEPTPESEG